jgi:hypothetical protein
MALLETVLSWIGSNAALVVAVCALAVTTSQLRAARRHNQLSVQPHLVVTAERFFEGPKARFVVKMRNNGLGPAVVVNYEALHNGKPVNTREFEEVMETVKALVGRHPMNCNYHHLAKGDAYAKDQEVTLLSVELPMFLGDVGSKLLEPLEQLSTRITYRSMYGEQFVYDSDKAGR